MAKFVFFTLFLLVAAVLIEINADFFDNGGIGEEFSPFGGNDLDDSYQKGAMTKGFSNPFFRDSNSGAPAFESQALIGGSQGRKLSPPVGRKGNWQRKFKRTHHRKRTHLLDYTTQFYRM